MSHSLTQSDSDSLVVLSVAIGVLASLNALHLTGRIQVTEGRTRVLWLAGGALSMGVGIWSMHFVGMLALQLSVPVAYALPQLAESVGVAIGASGFALWIAGRVTVRRWELAAAAAVMGMAIAGMHYIGMAGMTMPASIVYDTAFYWLSVAIAVTASFVALVLARRLRTDESRRGHVMRAAAALIVWFAIAGMHYTGMAAANFVPMPHAGVVTNLALPPSFLAALVTVGGVLLGGLALVAAMLDRLVRNRTVEAQLRAEKEAADATNRAKSEFLHGDGLAADLAELLGGLRRKIDASARPAA